MGMGSAHLGSPGRLRAGLDQCIRTLPWGLLRTQKDRVAGVGGAKESAFSTSTLGT